MSQQKEALGYIQNQGLDLLRENIPGAMFQCLYDENLTIQRVNDEFLKIVGYTREELKTRFHNSFLEMIDERDREPLFAEVAEQLKLGDTKEIEYRIKGRDGNPIWVLDEGRLLHAESGPDSFCCILIDISKMKAMQEQYRLSLERHQIIMNQTKDIIFEWDIGRDRLDFSNTWYQKFGYQPLTEGVGASLDTNSHIYPKDRVIFRRLLEQIRGGERYVEGEVRLHTLDSRYIWCRIRLTGQQDRAGNPVKAVGVIIDIDDEKRQNEQLKEVARRDMLTKLYNKGACERLIEEHLNRGQLCGSSALLIVDVDDFKLVNDTMGHLFGDAFLAKLAGEIQKQFRSQDIIGRIGGDEFMIFIKDIPDVSVINRKGQQLVDILKQLTVPEMGELSVSCSIGIALVPEHGKTFQELYRNADLALYQAKSSGKNCYVIYNDQMDMRVSSLVKRSDTVFGSKIDSDEGSGALNHQLIEYVFKILYKSVDVYKAVQSILEIVGRQFDVSRAYIFENSLDDKYCSNTFEWCNVGIEPEKDNLKWVAYEEDLEGSYIQNFDENGIFYCPDITTLKKKHFEILDPQGIKAILQCAIWDHGRFRGYVGFDDCHTNRYWTQEQIDVLNFISELLSTFLLKQRAQERVVKALEDMRGLLDSQDSWIYVIDPGTYHMMYINRKTLELASNSRTGMRCYEAFFNRNKPCEICPARRLKEGGCHKLEVYNPILKVWSMANASWITWEGRDAIMLCCHDITRYKEEASDVS